LRQAAGEFRLVKPVLRNEPTNFRHSCGALAHACGLRVDPQLLKLSQQARVGEGTQRARPAGGHLVMFLLQLS